MYTHITSFTFQTQICNCDAILNKIIQPCIKCYNFNCRLNRSCSREEAWNYKAYRRGEARIEARIVYTISCSKRRSVGCVHYKVREASGKRPVG